MKDLAKLNRKHANGTAVFYAIAIYESGSLWKFICISFQLNEHVWIAWGSAKNGDRNVGHKLTRSKPDWSLFTLNAL